MYTEFHISFPQYANLFKKFYVPQIIIIKYITYTYLCYFTYIFILLNISVSFTQFKVKMVLIIKHI